MASHWIWGDRIHKRVILDSNALMMCFEYSIDIEGELTRLLGSYQIIIPIFIKQELERLSKKSNGKKNINAKAALHLIKKYDMINVNGNNADDSLVDVAQQLHAVVVTNDKELRQRLKDVSVVVVFLRAKKILALE